MGLYDPSRGQIWVDDQPLSALDLPSWQQRLGVVSQDTFLFNASIAENLSFGLGGVLQSRELAAAQAQAAGFIEALPRATTLLWGSAVIASLVAAPALSLGELCCVGRTPDSR